MLRICVLLVIAVVAPCGWLRATDVRFNDHIRPILAENCLGCHGPDGNKREGDLRLDLETEARKVIDPNNPNGSELFQRIITPDAELRMPPPASNKKLSAEQIDTLRSWIASGAEFQGHWAFEPIVKPNLPNVDGDSLTDIDRFLVAKLKARGLTFSPPIGRAQWLRRATFDLLGIPPTWEEVKEFEEDDSPLATEKVIDRLLDSPLYGQRWGRHWLDIARYADTHGGAAIGFTKFPFSYTYRDYVIRAFNDDLPYDRFIVEQLAADQIGLPPNHDSLAALGFLTVGMQFRNKHDVIDDQIDVVTRGLLGLTVACARCHDHKYDAIPTENYYALYATFAASQAPDLLPLIGVPMASEEFRRYEVELANAQAVHEDLAREQIEIMRGRLRMQVGMYLTELVKGTPEQDLSSAFLSYRTDDLRPLVTDRWREYLARLPDDDPVFGPWYQLSRLAADGFSTQAAGLVERLAKENGEPLKPQDMRRLDARTPKWNPRVLDALSATALGSMFDVADVYGKVFANAHREWLSALLSTSAEADSAASIVPDEDERHISANSSILRQLRRHLYAANTPTAIPDDVAISMLNRTAQDTVRGKRGAIENIHLSSAGSPPRAMILQEKMEPLEFTVFRRGNPLERGDPVKPHFLSVLSDGAPQTFADGKRRLGLAQAIIAPDNPLTSRVLVNWAWQRHFGMGLVRSPDDFGTRGEPPSNPQLLDFLASSFIEDGYSIKKLHRRIMRSAAYRQAALESESARAIDPENTLFWRMPRRKLDLEAMRDSMLAVSAELDTSFAGRPFDLHAQPVVPRRSIYGFVNRDIVNSLSSTFDGANPNACTAQRPDTTVPQQTLFALNSDFIQDRADQLAALSEKLGTENERIVWLFCRLYARDPGAEELLLATSFLHSEDGQQSDPSAAAPGRHGLHSRAVDSTRWSRLAHVLLAANEFVFID